MREAYSLALQGSINSRPASCRLCSDWLIMQLTLAISTVHLKHKIHGYINMSECRKTIIITSKYCQRQKSQEIQPFQIRINFRITIRTFGLILLCNKHAVCLV